MARTNRMAGKRRAQFAKAPARNVKLRGAPRAALDKLEIAVETALRSNPADPESPQDARRSRFKIAVYRRVRRMFEKGQQHLIKSMVLFDDGRKTIDFNRNPYNWALLALKQSLSLDLEKDYDFRLTPNDLNVMGWQLIHAHRHQIDPDLLIGFLYQTASSSSWKQKLIKKPGAPYLEPWFVEFEKRIRPSLSPRLASLTE